MDKAIVYLIPTTLADDTLHTIPSYVLDAIKQCQVLFVEQERTARRFLKALDRTIEIADFTWHTIHKVESDILHPFSQAIQEKRTIGIISEAGCPGIADPGQLLVARAQELGAVVKPLVGPSSLLLGLMASGMNGQQFSFHGYLPIDAPARAKMLRDLELESKRNQSAHLFIETPYRNQAMLQAMLQTLQHHTRICIASAITDKQESIQTKTVAQWKQQTPELHKIPTLFILQAN